MSVTGTHTAATPAAISVSSFVRSTERRTTIGSVIEQWWLVRGWRSADLSAKKGALLGVGVEAAIADVVRPDEGRSV
jgi:hypothetical protein